MKLSPETRLEICRMLDEGAEYDAIRTAPEIAEECAEKSLALHGSTFLAYQSSAEFDEYRKRRRQWDDGFERNRMAALLARMEGGADNIAALADYELLKICLEKLSLGGDLEAKELASISRAVASYNRNRIADRFAEKEAAYQAKIAELSTQLAAAATGNAGLTEDTLKKIEEGIGLL